MISYQTILVFVVILSFVFVPINFLNNIIAMVVYEFSRFVHAVMYNL